MWLTLLVGIHSSLKGVIQIPKGSVSNPIQRFMWAVKSTCSYASLMEMDWSYQVTIQAKKWGTPF